jgi:tripartite-type tricarboxylate transporter receptor subunit TctC
MKICRRQLLHLAGTGAALAAAPRATWADAYPAHPVRIIVGFAAGSTTDVLGRLFGQWLSQRLGQ